MRFKSKLRVFFEILTFVIAVSTAAFYISDTMTGTPVFAKALKVIGFCPAPAVAVSGEQGVPGEQGEQGIQGPAGACQAPMNLLALSSNLLPSKDNVFSLGSPKLRWKDIQVGPGTIYLEDKTTGEQVGLTVIGGTLLLDGTDSLRIGNIRLTENGIESILSEQDIRIGNFGDKGFVSIANGIKFPDGSIFTKAPVDGAVGPVGPQGPQGATGNPGPQGARGGWYGSFFDTTNQNNTNPAIAYAMKFNSTDGANGVSINDSSKIRVANSGVYNIQFSAQLINTSLDATTFDIWLAKNGEPVTNTNTTVSLDKKQTRYVAAWNFMIDLNANDYVELMWFSGQANAQIHYVGPQVNPTRPAVPSVILTVHQVS